MPNKVDQDATNRIRMIADRGEVDKHSMELTCHGAAPKPGKLLDRTLALATESRPQRRNSFPTNIVSALCTRQRLWNIVAWSARQVTVFMVC